MFGETISYNAAFIAGLLSFFSPCILPLIPAYFTFITGLSIDELTESAKETRRKVILSTLVYVSGFSFVFIIMGASASFFGNLMFEYSWVVRYLGGTIIIIFSFFNPVGRSSSVALHLICRSRISRRNWDK